MYFASFSRQQTCVRLSKGGVITQKSETGDEEGAERLAAELDLPLITRQEVHQVSSAVEFQSSSNGQITVEYEVGKVILKADFHSGK